MHAHQIVAHVLKRFHGLPVRLARLFGKSTEWWSSHGRTPKRLDEYGTGNMSPVDPYMEFCERYDAASPGAGRALNEMVYAELRFRFAPCAPSSVKQNSIRRGVTKEASELIMALDEKEISEASSDDLRRWDSEVADLVGAAYQAQDFIRRELSSRANKGRAAH